MEDESIILSAKDGYDQWSRFYDSDDIPLNILEERYVDGAVGDVKGLRVLDLACGTGRQSLRMATKGARVTAIDQSSGMLERAKSKDAHGQVKFQLHDINSNLPFESASFHLVTCFLALEHIQNLQEFFKEAGRVCRSRGIVLCTAMHPAMLLRGVQARFTDPVTQQKVYPAGFQYQVSDYLNAATQSGLRLVSVHEDWCTSEDIARSERAEKYLHWPLLLGLKFIV